MPQPRHPEGSAGGSGSTQDGSPEPPALPVAAVARRLGVAPATLRTWDRRYGLGPSSHATGTHRRYSGSDLARLETMRRLTLEGVGPAEAARAALTAPAAVPAAAATPQDGEGRPHGGPGGRVLSLPGASAVTVGLGRAAMALDSEALLAIVRAQLVEQGVLATWDHVLRPVLVAAGARWAATGEGVEVEHLLSECVVTALREVAPTGPRRTSRVLLLASAPAEPHALPLHAVAAGLAERGLASRVLGGSMPAAAIRAAVRRTGAAALFVWSQLPATGSPDMLHDVPVTRPPTRVVIGGPGWDLDAVPRRVSVAHDLGDAVSLMAQAVGG